MTDKGKNIITVVVVLVLVIGLGVATAVGVQQNAAGRKAYEQKKSELPKTDCELAERLLDLYSAEVADGVTSSIDRHKKQVQKLKLMGCPGWQY